MEKLNSCDNRIMTNNQRILADNQNISNKNCKENPKFKQYPCEKNNSSSCSNFLDESKATINSKIKQNQDTNEDQSNFKIFTENSFDLN